jgi:DNA-binding transcriptional LysR family regulator
VTKGLLPMALDRMLREYPGLKIEVVESVDDVLKDALMKSEIDLAITTTPADDDEMQTVLRSGWRTTMHFVGATTHALASRKSVALEELMNERWVMPPAPSLPRQSFNRIFLDAGCNVPSITAQSRSHGVTLALVANGGFLSLMSQPHYQAELAAGLLKELHVPGVSAQLEFHALARRNRTMPAPARALLTILTELRL